MSITKFIKLTSILILTINILPSMFVHGMGNIHLQDSNNHIDSETTFVITSNHLLSLYGDESETFTTFRIIGNTLNGNLSLDSQVFEPNQTVLTINQIESSVLAYQPLPNYQGSDRFLWQVQRETNGNGIAWSNAASFNFDIIMSNTPDQEVTDETSDENDDEDTNEQDNNQDNEDTNSDETNTENDDNSDPVFEDNNTVNPQDEKLELITNLPTENVEQDAFELNNLGIGGGGDNLITLSFVPLPTSPSSNELVRTGGLF